MVELSKEVIDFCNIQYKKKSRCSNCFLHAECAVNYIITKENIDSHRVKLNKSVHEYNKLKK